MKKRCHPNFPTPTLTVGTHRLRVLKPGHVGVVIHGGVRVGGSERRRGRERPGGRGEDSGPRPGDATKPRSPAGGGGKRESSKEGASREDQLLGAQITAFPSPYPPNPAGPTPSAAEESGACSYNNSARPPDTPSPGAGGVAAGAPASRGARDPAGKEGGGPELGRRWVPQAPMGQRGGGEEGEERLRAGRIQARRRRGEESCGDRDARQPRKYSAGKQRAGAEEGGRVDWEGVRPEPRKDKAQVTGRQNWEKGGTEAEGGNGERQETGETEDAGREGGRSDSGGGEGPQVRGRCVWASAVRSGLGRNRFGDPKPIP